MCQKLSLRIIDLETRTKNTLNIKFWNLTLVELNRFYNYVEFLMNLERYETDDSTTK